VVAQRQVMNPGRAAHFLRQCAGSLTSRHSTRSPVNYPHRLIVAGRRYYSEDIKQSEDKAEDSTEEKSQAQNQVSELAAKLQKKEAEVVDLLSRLRYLQADFLNLQRNAAREKEQTRDFAISRFASDLLETVDVLSLALKSVPEPIATSSSNASPPPPSDSSSSSPASSSSPPQKSPEAYLTELYTGVEMTHRLLLQTLFKYNVKPFDPTGDKFDPNKHEALYQAPIPGKEPGTVNECQKLGYTIKDRVLRAAQVGVVQDAS